LFRRDERCQSSVEGQTIKVTFPPIDLAYGAAILESVGWQCRIADLPAEKLSFEDLEHILNNYKPDMLVVKITTSTLSGDIEAMNIARRTLPDLKILVFGGIDTKNTISNERILEFANIILENSPEDILYELGRDYAPLKVSGLIYKNGSDVVNTGFRKVERDMDEYPFPARHLLKNELYVNPENNKRITLIRTSQGCKFKCIFCPAYKISSGNIRRRSPEHIIKEIKECIEKFGIDDFHFDADTFTMNKKWTKELCEKIISENLAISWYCNSRVDTIDLETLKLMKTAGCRVIGFGIESGNQETLDRIKKKITLEQAERAVSIAREAGVYSHTFFVIGLPWETEELILETFDFIKKLDPDFFDINIAYPIPDTELYKMCSEMELFSEKGNSPLSYSDSPIKTRFLSREQLIRLRKEGLKKLYLRPSYIMKTLNKVLLDPKKAIRYIRYGLRRLNQL